MDSSNVVRCPVCGQSYDTRRNTNCPNCSQLAVVPTGSRVVDNDVTVIQRANFTSPLDETVSVDTSLGDTSNDVTIGISLSQDGNKRGEITGWLVCISGPDFGKDFRIRYNNNFIGRDMDMDVCIASDNAVHKQKHMTVVYEPNENTFFCGSVGGAICYLNGELISKSTQLKDFDKIKLGNTELVFRSLCGEEYRW